jgi:hypothetical protein
MDTLLGSASPFLPSYYSIYLSIRKDMIVRCNGEGKGVRVGYRLDAHLMKVMVNGII